jgi:hypothetical protein
VTVVRSGIIFHPTLRVACLVLLRLLASIVTACTSYHALLLRHGTFLVIAARHQSRATDAIKYNPSHALGDAPPPGHEISSWLLQRAKRKLVRNGRIPLHKKESHKERPGSSTCCRNMVGGLTDRRSIHH